MWEMEKINAKLQTCLTKHSAVPCMCNSLTNCRFEEEIANVALILQISYMRHPFVMSRIQILVVSTAIVYDNSYFAHGFYQ